MAGVHWSTDLAEKVSWYCALFLAIMLILSCCESSNSIDQGEIAMIQHKEMVMKRSSSSSSSSSRQQGSFSLSDFILNNKMHKLDLVM